MIPDTAEHRRALIPTPRSSQGPREADPEKTSLHTHHLLVSAQLAFAFAHGILIITTSLKIGSGVAFTWWTIFVPVWLGSVVCIALLIASWFASCPYIRKCIAAQQARIGATNPSILTEILPQIVMSLFGFLVVVLSLAGEVVFCWCLVRRSEGKDCSLLPAAAVFLAVSMLVLARGLLVRTNGSLFIVLGFALLWTSAVAPVLLSGTGPSAWVLVIPMFSAAIVVLVFAVRRLRRHQSILSREERCLRRAEQLILAWMVVAMVVLMAALRSDRPGAAAGTGVFIGTGACAISALRARMAVVERRAADGARLPIRERLVLLEAGIQTTGSPGPGATAVESVPSSSTDSDIGFV